ncbi:MAG: P-type conjugative transfer protein TrbL [Burkholderiales bacterium]|nr:P-type conjugative transfer protein TrbL [Burkholderiales bacterium]
MAILRKIIKHLFLIFLFNMPILCLAYTQTTFNPQGFMNKMLNDLMGSTSTWHTVFVPAATSLFLFLSATEFSFDTGVRLLHGGEPGKMLGFAVLRLLMVALFLYFVKNVDWVYQIIAQYKEWAYQAGGLTAGYGPSEIAGIGVEIASDFFSAVTLSYTDVLKEPGLILLGIVSVFAGFCIMAAFGWAALQLFCIYVEFYLVINAGIINLGFLGSSWTRDMGKKYFTYIIAVGTKLLVGLLVVAAVKDETGMWASQVLAHKNDFNAMLNTMAMLMVDSLMVAVMVSSIPAYAAGVITGVSTASANQAFSAGMAMTGAMGMTVGAAAGGAFMLYGAGKSATGAAIDALRNRGTGTGDMSPGGSSPTPPSGSDSPDSGNSSAQPSPDAQAGIGSGSSLTGSSSMTNSSSNKPSAAQRGMSTLGKSKNMAGSAVRHWHNTQTSGHVSPPDLRGKHLDF